jgi:hypothetical protein
MTARRRRLRAGILGLVALLAFMLLVVYASFQVSGVRCEVCITFDGRSQCRTVDGESRSEALMAATSNVCAFLASGVTDSMACSRTPPTKAECVARE